MSQDLVGHCSGSFFRVHRKQELPTFVLTLRLTGIFRDFFDLLDLLLTACLHFMTLTQGYDFLLSLA